jgi:TolA-binding protein
MQAWIKIVFLIAILSIAISNASGQTPLDDISRAASQLEAELGKYKDTSPEAADAMTKLIQLYHDDARVFGLVRIGNRFIAAHPTDPRHKDMMLRTLDGLQAMSRNSEFIVLCRQFLFRYPNAAECADIEMRLAESLVVTGDNKAAAAALHDVWKRQGNRPEGRRAAIRAIDRYMLLGNDQIEIGAVLAEELLAANEGAFAIDAGLKSVHSFARIGKWAESNRAAQTLLNKKLVTDAKQLRELHLRMAENYARLNQHTSSVAAYNEVRRIRDDQAAHAALLDQLGYAKASSKDISAIAKDYAQQYSERDDRFRGLSILAQAYVREENPDAATSLLGKVLALDAITNDSGQLFVQQNGSEPDRMIESEKVLRDAITKNDRHAAYLRYVLAFSLYRDRMKNEDKTREVLRELIDQSPSDDGYTRSAIDWLLNAARDDKEFSVDLARILKARRDHAELASITTFIQDWQNGARRDKNRSQRAELVKQELEKADRGAIESLIAKQRFQHSGNEAKIRDELLAENVVGKLAPAYVDRLLDAQGYFYRHHVGGNERKASATYYGKLAMRQKSQFEPARRWLESATDFSPPEVAKEAAIHLLSLPPADCGSDVWRRLMQTAEKSKDAEHAKKCFAWIRQCQAKFGNDSGAASYIGDVLYGLELKSEAIKVWETYFALDPLHYESRECAARLVRELEPAKQIAFLEQLVSYNTPYHGRYATWLADEYLKQKNLDKFAEVLSLAKKRHDEHPFEAWDIDQWRVHDWIVRTQRETETTDEQRTRVYSAIQALQCGTQSAAAQLALMQLSPDEASGPKMPRMLACRQSTVLIDNSWNAWDALFPFAQSFLTNSRYMEAATVASGLIAGFPRTDENRLKSAREIVTQSYTRMGSVGLTIDESSPLAPLLQAALYLRLGDEALALSTYDENRELFNAHRNELPVDLIRFVCRQRIAAGGDENHEFVEDVLRSWLVDHSESKQVEEESKAEIQLLLATNYFKAKRYDVARTEFTSTINRYPDSKQAIEARFGIGESFMAQKVYDQAELVFEELARSHEMDIVVRAEFLRGVLAFRRGDHDDARDIFRSVLERVPSVELANQALFSLSEVYGSEERYIDQLNLLRTVGRLGRRSTRLHSPGLPLSIVVHDSDLGISRGHNKIPVVVTTKPGGDVERVMLTSAGAGRGLFRFDVPTRLGDAVPGDGILEVLGEDTIQCDYPDEFKSEFKRVPLSDVEIRIASTAKFEAASSKITDKEIESFSDRMAREASEEETGEEDLRVSQQRPENQIKPGNDIYLRVIDPDRDRTNDRDEIPVKLVADSGDQLQVRLIETEPHTGIFEGTAKTAELPAGALASDTAINHNPLMAIDRDPNSAWVAEPGGATPKTLTVDMKDLRNVTRLRMTTPNAEKNAPVRFDLMGSNDGEFWFRMVSHPASEKAAPAEKTFGQMRQRVYPGKYFTYSNWNQVADLGWNREASETSEVNALSWTEDADEEKKRNPHAVIWSGKFVQPRDGAVRIAVKAALSAIAVGNSLELPVGKGGRSVDVWLARGSHDLTIFAATDPAGSPVEATIARASLETEQVRLLPFTAPDFDLNSAVAKATSNTESTSELTLPTVAEVDSGDKSGKSWELTFPSRDIRYTKLAFHEFLGESVAINNLEIGGPDSEEPYIPTKQDVLALATNDALEMGAGDTVTATYTDEVTQNETGASQLLSAKLKATYFNAETAAITYAFTRDSMGRVSESVRQLKRIDAGERIIVEVRDYDQDQTSERDEIDVEVFVNDGEPVRLKATETEEYSGIFTKEVDTTDKEAADKLTVKPGDRVFLRYFDVQNTFPGHRVPRETVVYVNQPTDGEIRIIQTRAKRQQENDLGPPQIEVIELAEGQTESLVALDAPLTIEVIDPDQAKHSGSTVKVAVLTTDGSAVIVECAISSLLSNQDSARDDNIALEQGRFIGQVILQLGGANSPELVPKSAQMPRNLVGTVQSTDRKANESSPNPMIVRVLNVTGKDTINAAYQDKETPSSDSPKRLATSRLVTDGVLTVTDREFREPIESLHVGEKIFVAVNDPDQDLSDERDVIRILVQTERGERESVELSETLSHSGFFAGSFLLVASETPTVDSNTETKQEIECYFGDTLTLTYTDPTSARKLETHESKQTIPVVVGTDGLVTAFTKTFNDETLAVETKFRIAESYFELFKSHKELERTEDQTNDLESGRRVLREVMEDYPDPKYAPRIAYLLGQFAQELEQWDEAIRSYEMIIRRYPDHTLAADARYKLAQSYEEAGDFDAALEAYVTLAATHPNSPLIASVMIRISDYFYKRDDFEIAAQVGEKFGERFEGHEHAAEMAFRVGQCYYKSEDYKRAGLSFDQFAKTFPDDELGSDSLFWSGEAYRLAKNDREAFRRYNRCRWDYPESEAAKYARGRLALPEMLQQFEAEANSVDDE